MSISNPYQIVIISSAITAVACIACNAIFLKEKNPWIPLIKGCGLAFSIVFILAMLWTVMVI